MLAKKNIQILDSTGPPLPTSKPTCLAMACANLANLGQKNKQLRSQFHDPQRGCQLTPQQIAYSHLHFLHLHAQSVGYTYSRFKPAPQGQRNDGHNGVIFAIWPCSCTLNILSCNQHHCFFSPGPLCWSFFFTIVGQRHLLQQSPSGATNFEIAHHFTCYQLGSILHQHHVTSAARTCRWQLCLAAAIALITIHIWESTL